MMKTEKARYRRLRMVFVWAVAMMWAFALPVVATAQHADSDSPGGAEATDAHDHDAHVEEEAHAEDEHGDHDAHVEEETDDDHSDEAHAEDEDGDDDAHDHDGESHEDEDDHAASSAVGEAGHEGHDHAAHEGEEEGLSLTSEQRKRFGIVIDIAGPGSLRNEVSLPGEIVFNEDRVVHMVPRVAGIAREVHKTVGDRVKTGEVLAVIESRELADAKSEYLAAKARAALAEKGFVREKALRDKQVSSEQDFLEAEQAFAEARIDWRSAEQKLHALGLTETAVDALGDDSDEHITRYEIRSAIEGVVTEKHIVLGESLDADADIFTVVDDSSVWVNLTVYTKNLAAVRTGEEVTLRVDHSGAQGRGRVVMVTPFVEESTRSATARVVLDNRDGRWMPGTFVTGFISNSKDDLPVVVHRDVVQSIEGRDVVFVEHEGRFEMAPVTLGRTDRTNVEIVAGLEPGTRYVAEGAFQLKATVITSTLDSHAGHGH